jgi:hypothetical protein
MPAIKIHEGSEGLREELGWRRTYSSSVPSGAVVQSVGPAECFSLDTDILDCRPLDRAPSGTVRPTPCIHDLTTHITGQKLSTVKGTDSAYAIP